MSRITERRSHEPHILRELGQLARLHSGFFGSKILHGVIVSNSSFREIAVSNIIWVIVIGFIAGLIARMLSPGPNNPRGFILTTLVGIAGAFISTFIGQMIGWYRLDQGAGLIGATLGAVILLFIWNRLVVHHLISDPGVPGGPDAPTTRRWL
jgi:uncharacterized membrane protein YeaQ/YmgE (transglycosylase-associated protein family)